LPAGRRCTWSSSPRAPAEPPSPAASGPPAWTNSADRVRNAVRAGLFGVSFAIDHRTTDALSRSRRILLVQLLLRLRKHILPLELHRPVDRNLRPHQKSPACPRRASCAGRAGSAPDALKFPPNSFTHAQQRGHVPVVAHAAGAERSLGVDAYAVQQQSDCHSAESSCPKSQSFGSPSRRSACRARLQHQRGKSFGRLRRPQRQPGAGRLIRNSSLGIRHTLRVQLRRGQIDRKPASPPALPPHARSPR